MCVCVCARVAVNKTTGTVCWLNWVVLFSVENVSQSLCAARDDTQTVCPGKT